MLLKETASKGVYWYSVKILDLYLGGTQFESYSGFWRTVSGEFCGFLSLPR
jgi:hypothetical protein